ncbi:MAG: hypothetical protein ABSE86_03040 [Bryobacteraceae bacterium]|jgi:hypothetical protein
MASCTYCGGATNILDREFPVCLNCANQHEANPQLTPARKLQAILARHAEEVNNIK